MKDRQSNDPSRAIKSPVKKLPDQVVLVLQGEDTVIGEQVVFRAFDLRLQSHRFWRILLKKAKVERLRKSRQGQFLIVSAAASRCRAGTKVCDRFCANRCSPSRCRARDAPGGLKNFVRQPEETFSTVRPMLSKN